jgi:multidrug resistance efflux pump
VTFKPAPVEGAIQIADLDERMVAARSTLDHIEIRAPAAGVAVGLNAHTVGGVIKPGDIILEIVPSPQRLVLRLKSSPMISTMSRSAWIPTCG